MRKTLPLCRFFSVVFPLCFFSKTLPFPCVPQEVRADRHTQVLVTTADTCFPAAGGLAAIQEAAPAYKALGGSLDTFVGVWHHGWVLPTREQLNGFFCKALWLGTTAPAACANSTELDVSAQNPGGNRPFFLGHQPVLSRTPARSFSDTSSFFLAL